MGENALLSAKDRLIEAEATACLLQLQFQGRAHAGDKVPGLLQAKLSRRGRSTEVQGLCSQIDVPSLP